MTDISLLPAVEIETAGAPDAAVLFLHGLGDDGHGWSDVIPALKLPASLRVRFLFPHAQEQAVTINGGYVMPAWYDILDADFRTRADLNGVQVSQSHVEHLIARERQRGVRASRIVLGGFSQGGAIALYAGLRHREKLAGIAALSTYLVGAENLVAQAHSANRHTPIFMAHGELDEVVRYDWGDRSRALLVEHGWKVEWHHYPMPHSAVMEEIEELGRFITRVLAPA